MRTVNQIVIVSPNLSLNLALKDDRHLYVVYSLCADSLFRLARGGKMLSVDTGELIEALAQLCSAVAHVHDMGVVHRDVKAENVLVSVDGNTLLLADFGLSKRLTRRQRAKCVCGTLQYMAPEVLAEQAYAHAIDWWSLGVLAHRLAFGTMPYAKGQDHKETLTLLLNSRESMEASSQRCRDKDVREFLAACLCFDEDERTLSVSGTMKKVEERAALARLESAQTRVNFIDVFAALSDRDQLEECNGGGKQ